MESIKINQGPKSPADLQWSQGAKNPRKENQTDYNNDLGTLLGDTKDSTVCGTETSNDEICSENESIDHPLMSDTTSEQRPIRSCQILDKKIRKKLIHKIQKGKTDLNDPVLNEIPNDKLCLNVQPRRKWYKSVLRLKKVIYKEIMNNPLLIAVLCGGNRKGSLSQEQCDLIINKLTQNVYHLSEEQFIPKFESFTLKDGVLLITCFNEDSAMWLKQEDFLGLWKAGTVMALNQYDFQQGFRYITFVPGSFRSSKLILKFLTLQNPNLHAFSNFIIIRRNEKEDEGVEFRFEINENAAERIEALNMKPYCGIKRIHFSYTGTIKSNTKKHPKSFQETEVDRLNKNFLKSSKSFKQGSKGNIMKRKIVDNNPQKQPQVKRYYQEPYDHQTIPHLSSDLQYSHRSKIQKNVYLGSPPYPTPQDDGDLPSSGPYWRHSRSTGFKSTYNLSDNFKISTSFSQPQNFERSGYSDPYSSSVDNEYQERSRYCDSKRTLHANQDYSNSTSYSHYSEYSNEPPQYSKYSKPQSEFPTSSEKYNARECKKSLRVPTQLEQSGYWFNESRPSSSRSRESVPGDYDFSRKYARTKKHFDSFNY